MRIPGGASTNPGGKVSIAHEKTKRTGHMSRFSSLAKSKHYRRGIEMEDDTSQETTHPPHTRTMRFIHNLQLTTRLYILLY